MPNGDRYRLTGNGRIVLKEEVPNNREEPDEDTGSHVIDRDEIPIVHIADHLGVDLEVEAGEGIGDRKHASILLCLWDPSMSMVLHWGILN